MKTNQRPYEKVAEGLRNRIESGEWQAGHMVPGRRILAAEYGVASATLERAVGTLIAEGVMSASDRRGTFVCATSQDRRPAPTPGPALPSRRETLHATVGIIAGVVPYQSLETRTGQWSAQILAACEHGLAAERGLTQRFVNLIPDIGKDITPAEAAKRLLADRVDAIVTISCSPLDVVPAVEAAGIPLVSVDYDPVSALIPQVYLDGAAGGALAAQHLREKGYRHLTYLRPFVNVWVEARLSGAKSADGTAGLRVFPAEARPDAPTSMDAAEHERVGAEIGRALLADGLQPLTGVIAPNDAVAVGFMKAAHERGMEAGVDYGIVGFDDSHREVHLTSLRPPLEALGEEAARLVIRLLRGEASATRIALQHRLIARSSTALAGAVGSSERGA